MDSGFGADGFRILVQGLWKEVFGHWMEGLGQRVRDVILETWFCGSPCMTVCLAPHMAKFSPLGM